MGQWVCVWFLEPLGRKIERSKDIDYDFVDPSPGGLGKISLKGPLIAKNGRLLPPNVIDGQLDNLAEKILRDANPTSAADTVAVDLFGLSPQQANYLKQAVAKGLPNNAKPIKYTE
jgi:hypothetical protein